MQNKHLVFLQKSLTFVNIFVPPSSASRDGKILHNDVRRQDPVVGSSNHHTLEVCGLEWSADGSKLASGGDDNMVCVWASSDLSQPAQVLKGHKAAVKVSQGCKCVW